LLLEKLYWGHFTHTGVHPIQAQAQKGADLIIAVIGKAEAVGRPSPETRTAAIDDDPDPPKSPVQKAMFDESEAAGDFTNPVRA
jgi:hypothetical protein